MKRFSFGGCKGTPHYGHYGFVIDVFCCGLCVGVISYWENAGLMFELSRLWLSAVFVGDVGDAGSFSISEQQLSELERAESMDVTVKLTSLSLPCIKLPDGWLWLAVELADGNVLSGRGRADWLRSSVEEIPVNNVAGGESVDVVVVVVLITVVVVVVAVAAEVFILVVGGDKLFADFSTSPSLSLFSSTSSFVWLCTTKLLLFISSIALRNYKI